MTLSVELADQHPHLAREINEGFIRLKGIVNRLLEQGKASGEVRNEIDTGDMENDRAFYTRLKGGQNYGFYFF